MTSDSERDEQTAALRERLARLSEASLRASESLDLEWVLREVVESARVLTGAANAVITTVDQVAPVEGFISSGLTPEELRQLHGLPDGERLWAYLLQSTRPLRVDDLASHVDALGFPTAPILHRSFLGVPIRHRGVNVGHFYLTNKEGGREFTDEDEETLVMFAAPAAAAITNARRHLDERRARADLETLIDTSPVGVVVFDVKTGRPPSLNREARRLGNALQGSESSVEQILEKLTIRRADGTEASLQDLPLTELLAIGETVRAEQIVMRVPDGGSVTVLLNATPIRSEDGAVESVVVTLQDMTPLEELDRMRAEFLGMVSHELRVPLTSIKGSTATLLNSLTDLDPTEMRQFHRIIDQQAEHMRALIGDLLDVARIETGTLLTDQEPVEVPALVDRARSTFASGGGRNNLVIDLPPDLPRVLADRRRIVQVLVNLLSNAARHSPESSAIRVTAIRDGVHVAFSVADEGRGIPAERLPHLFRKFSAAEGEGAEPEAGESGLGLAICKGIVEAHGGRIWAESEGPGLGARFTFTLTAVEEAGREYRGAPAQSQKRATERERILVVDDDPETLRFVRHALTEAGYEPTVSADPEEALDLMKEGRPHLVLVDLVLPGSDGVELMQDMHRVDDVPVIFISVYGRDQVISRALEAGASDYIVKPFSPTELVARIRAAQRKHAGLLGEPSEPYVVGELTIDYGERRVTVGTAPVALTPIEYGLLYELSTHGGRVVGHDRLLQRVWAAEKPGSLRTLRTHVMRLRQKLGDDPEHPSYIITEPRVGYRMPKGEVQGGQLLPEAPGDPNASPRGQANT